MAARFVMPENRPAPNVSLAAIAPITKKANRPIRDLKVIENFNAGEFPE